MEGCLPAQAEVFPLVQVVGLLRAREGSFDRPTRTSVTSCQERFTSNISSGLGTSPNIESEACLALIEMRGSQLRWICLRNRRRDSLFSAAYSLFWGVRNPCSDWAVLHSNN